MATQTLTYLDIKATANRWAAEYGLEDDDMWTHPFTNVRMTITQVLWSLYTERYMSLEGMKMHFDRHGIFALQARKEAEEAEQAQKCCACDDETGYALVEEGELLTDIIHDAPDKAREEAEDAAFYASLMGNDISAHIEDDIHSGAFPDIEGLVSLSLAPAVCVQFDEQNGTLLLCVGMEQAIVEPEKVQELLELLYSERDAIHAACHKEVYC